MDKQTIMRKAIFDALERLLTKAASIQDITVQDILDECGLSRPTFYRYFSDKYDVINWSYTYHVEELTGLYNGTSSDEEMLRGFISFFYNRRDYFPKVMEYLGQNSFYDHYYAGLIRWYTTMRSVNEKDLTPEERYMLMFCAGGTSEVLQQWLNKGCRESPETIFEVLKDRVPAVTIF